MGFVISSWSCVENHRCYYIVLLVLLTLLWFYCLFFGLILIIESKEKKVSQKLNFVMKSFKVKQTKAI